LSLWHPAPVEEVPRQGLSDTGSHCRSLHAEPPVNNTF
jgi:hypothetical protein